MDKKWTPWIISAIAIITVILFSGAVFFLTRPSPLPHLTSTPRPSSVPTQKPTPTPSPTRTPLPTKTPFPAGSIWSVTKIINDAYHNEGFSYDVATFTNIETGQTLEAHCAEPQRPSPTLGTHYRLNEVGVLIPIHENIRYPLQRFIVLSH